MTAAEETLAVETSGAGCSPKACQDSGTRLAPQGSVEHENKMAATCVGASRITAAVLAAACIYNVVTSRSTSARSLTLALDESEHTDVMQDEFAAGHKTQPLCLWSSRRKVGSLPWSAMVRLPLVILYYERDRRRVDPEHGETRVFERASVRGLQHDSDCNVASWATPSFSQSQSSAG